MQKIINCGAIEELLVDNSLCNTCIIPVNSKVLKIDGKYARGFKCVILIVVSKMMLKHMKEY